MFDLFTSLSQDDLALVGGGIATMIGAAWVAWRGVVKGKPSPEMVKETIASMNVCSALLLSNDLGAIKSEQADIRADLEAMHDMLVRIEDRTRK